jgi:hypothetical protein
VDLPSLHDEDHAPERRDVLRRVAVHRDQVRVARWRDVVDPIAETR